VNKVAPFPFPSLDSMLVELALMLIPTQKHRDTPTKNVEFCPLIHHNTIAFLTKRLARMLMVVLSDLVCVVNFFHWQCHE
jgi:hypothetical protein